MITLPALLLVAVAGSPARDEPLLVTTDWLARHLQDRNLVVLHIGEKPGYDAAHIPGARYLAPTVELATPRLEGQLFLELPGRAVLDSVLSAKGISNESRVVLYPADGFFTATSRALFTLEYAGLRGRVSILDGGFEAWKREGRPVTSDIPPVVAGHFTTRPDSSIVADARFVHQHLRDARVRIVDARDSSFYNGRETGQGRTVTSPARPASPSSPSPTPPGTSVRSTCSSPGSPTPG
jgi:thiosulfate/3-mercaptopyruvate sulfurtransferase